MESKRGLTVLDKQQLICAHWNNGVDLEALSQKYDLTLRGVRKIFEQEDAILKVHPLVAAQCHQVSVSEEMGERLSVISRLGAGRFLDLPELQCLFDGIVASKGSNGMSERSKRLLAGFLSHGVTSLSSVELVQQERCWNTHEDSTLNAMASYFRTPSMDTAGSGEPQGASNGFGRTGTAFSSQQPMAQAPMYGTTRVYQAGPGGTYLEHHTETGKRPCFRPDQYSAAPHTMSYTQMMPTEPWPMPGFSLPTSLGAAFNYRLDAYQATMNHTPMAGSQNSVSTWFQTQQHMEQPAFNLRGGSNVGNGTPAWPLVPHTTTQAPHTPAQFPSDCMAFASAFGRIPSVQVCAPSHPPRTASEAPPESQPEAPLSQVTGERHVNRIFDGISKETATAARAAFLEAITTAENGLVFIPILSVGRSVRNDKGTGSLNGCTCFVIEGRQASDFGESGDLALFGYQFQNADSSRGANRAVLSAFRAMHHIFEAHGVQRRAGYDPFKAGQLICIHSATLNNVLHGTSGTAAIFLALYTRFMECKMRSDTAVTGYCSLVGSIRKIDMVNSKIRAAISAGYRRVVIPAANLGDVHEELKADSNVDIVPVSNVFELLNQCLADAYKLPEAAAASLQVAVQCSLAPWDATTFSRVECCTFPGTGKVLITGHEASEAAFIEGTSTDSPSLVKPGEREKGPARHAAGSVLVWLQHAQQEEWFQRLPRGCRVLDLSQMILMNQTAGVKKTEAGRQKADLHINFSLDDDNQTSVVGTAVALALAQTVRGLSFNEVVGGYGEVTPYGKMLPCRWSSGPLMVEPLRAILYAGYEGTESFCKVEVAGETLGKGVCNMQDAVEYVFQNIPYTDSTGQADFGRRGEEERKDGPM